MNDEDGDYLRFAREKCLNLTDEMDFLRYFFDEAQLVFGENSRNITKGIMKGWEVTGRKVPGKYNISRGSENGETKET
jgi:hypothetical protein